MTITHMKNMKTFSALEKSDRVDSFLSNPNAKIVFNYLVLIFDSDVHDIRKIEHNFDRLWYAQGLMDDYSIGSNGITDLFKEAVKSGFDGFLENFQVKCSMNNRRIIQDLKYLRCDTPWQGMIIGMMVEFFQNMDKPGGQKEFGNRVRDFMNLYMSFGNDMEYLNTAIGLSNGRYGNFQCFPDFLRSMNEIRERYDFDKILPKDSRETIIKYLHEVEKVRDEWMHNKEHRGFTMPNNMVHLINGVLSNLRGVILKLDVLTDSESHMSVTGKSNKINLVAMPWRASNNNGIYHDDLKSSYLRSAADGLECFMAEYMEAISLEFARFGNELRGIQHTLAAPALLFSKIENIVNGIATMDLANPLPMRNEIQEFNDTVSILRVLPDSVFILPDNLESRAKIIQVGESFDVKVSLPGELSTNVNNQVIDEDEDDITMILMGAQ